MPARDLCAKTTRSGSRCSAYATELHPALGPLCHRHADLLRRQLRGIADRSAVLHIRCTPAERDQLAQAAERWGCSVGDLVRRLALEQAPPLPPPSRAEALLNRQWAALGNLLNQAQQSLNTILRDRVNHQVPHGLTEEHLATVKATQEELHAARLELVRLRGGTTP